MCCRNILTHTAGFDEVYTGSVVTNDTILPLAEYLIRIKAPVVYPVGKVLAYSNYGWSLLGRIIENISTLSYEQVSQTTKRKIFVFIFSFSLFELDC